MGEDKSRKRVVFLSSSYVNIAKFFAMKNRDYDVFLILDRKFPFELQDLDNFYTYIFDKNKVFEKDKKRYFDNLMVFLNDYEPDIIITNNFTKLLNKDFIEFFKFTNPDTSIINIHHGDLRVKDNKSGMLYSGLNSEIRQFLDEGKLVSTLHYIKDDGMDNGDQIAYSYETTLKELKQKGFLKVKEEIINYRVKSVVISYHERTKLLSLLSKTVRNLIK